MNKQQSGFTLIELIMVIVVLGALAVTALPRYVDLEVQAQQGAGEGVAGSLAAGSAINFAECTALGGVGGTCLIGANMADCTDVAATLLGGALPAGYQITALPLVAGAGSVTNCTVTGDGLAGGIPVADVTAPFTAMTP